MRTLTTRTAALIAGILLLSSAAGAEVVLRQRSTIAAADAKTACVVSLAKKTDGSVLVTVRGAGPTQRVTLPWGVAHKLAYAANYGAGGLQVLTARDGFTGNMLRLVAGQGSEAVIVDRMRRSGANGQSGVSAIRVQLGVEKPWASFMGRTTIAGAKGELQVIGRSGPARGGAYPMDPFSLGLEQRSAKGKIWYYLPTEKVTHDPNAPLRPFAPYGGGLAAAAKGARLVGSQAVAAE
jgi:hypothetical protein